MELAVRDGRAEPRMAEPGRFPLLVEGSWGLDPPKNLSTKLQMYFQSPKRSGGGECEVRQEPGSPARFLVLFFPDDGEPPGGWMTGGTRAFSPGRLGTGARSGRLCLAPAAAIGEGLRGCRMDKECTGVGGR